MQKNRIPYDIEKISKFISNTKKKETEILKIKFRFLIIYKNKEMPKMQEKKQQQQITIMLVDI